MRVNMETSMTREAIDKMIGEALVNKRFRAMLLTSPVKVADSFHLSPEEQQLLSNLRADSLEELASQIYDEMSKCGGDYVSK